MIPPTKFSILEIGKEYIFEFTSKNKVESRQGYLLYAFTRWEVTYDNCVVVRKKLVADKVGFSYPNRKHTLASGEVVRVFETHVTTGAFRILEKL